MPLNSKSLCLDRENEKRSTIFQRQPPYENLQREHFTSDDFFNPYSSKKRLKANAVPSIFSWNKDKQETVQLVKRSALEKLNQWRTEEEEATDTASEGEGVMAVSTRTGEELIFRNARHKHMRMTSLANEMKIVEFPVYISFPSPTFFPNPQPQRQKTNCSHISLDLTVMMNS